MAGTQGVWRLREWPDLSYPHSAWLGPPTQEQWDSPVGPGLSACLCHQSCEHTPLWSKKVGPAWPQLAQSAACLYTGDCSSCGPWGRWGKDVDWRLALPGSSLWVAWAVGAVGECHTACLPAEEHRNIQKSHRDAIRSHSAFEQPASFLINEIPVDTQVVTWIYLWTHTKSTYLERHSLKRASDPDSTDKSKCLHI